MNRTYSSWGKWKSALSVTLICCITQGVWNLLGFKSSFFNNHFVSVMGFWYQHYLTFVFSSFFNYSGCKMICLSKLQLGNCYGKESGYPTREYGAIYPKLTKKGKAYQLTERRRERNRLKREIQSRIANIEHLWEFCLWVHQLAHTLEHLHRISV